MKIMRLLIRKLSGPVVLGGMVLATCTVSAQSAGNVIYAAPDGKTAAAGTIDDPYTIFRAVEKVAPGGTIYVRGGVYKFTDRRLNLDKEGTADRPYRMFAYRDEQPVFDCSVLDLGNVKSNNAIRVRTGSYWHVKGIDVTNCAMAGIRVENGNHNTFEDCVSYNNGKNGFELYNSSYTTFRNCVSHHNGGSGFSMGYGHEGVDKPDPNPDGKKLAYNTFINCDAYNNFDWFTEGKPGTNSDGFAARGKIGPGNKYVGCRAWSNSDDAWDFYECGRAVQLIDCWAWRTGVWSDHAEMYREKTGEELTEELFAGNGNGFKLGGACLYNEERDWCNGYSKGAHLLRNCIAFSNRIRGIDQNNHAFGCVVENCLTFGNGQNIGLWRANRDETPWMFRNNISFDGKRKDSYNQSRGVKVLFETNNWDLKLTDPKVCAGQFVSLSEEDARAPRGKDGSLPGRFGRLKAGSIFIDKGTITGPVKGDGFECPAIPYEGSAPDLGAFECRP